MTEMVVLVDKNDKKIGLMEKMEAHKKCLKHRAISVLVFNKNGELLLQQRADCKYHCPGKWANTCCTHPRDGENILAAGKRRLNEEMGFSTSLKESMSFNYKVKLDHGLWENEFDHVLEGKYDGEIRPNPEEVKNYKWVNLEDLKMDIAENPDIYAFWFKEIMKKWKKEEVK
jgi:isopentenyl-diphosphate delta-isomerase